MDTTIEKRVLAELSEREIVELAGELIRIPSVCPDETPVARFLAGYFETRGYDVELQEVEPGRFQTIATLRGAGGGQSLMRLVSRAPAVSVIRRAPSHRGARRAPWRGGPWRPPLGRPR